jgi:hypothetical protein
MIDAQGAASQSLTFDLAHILYDMDGLDRIDDLLPNTIKGKDLITKKREQVDAEILQHASSGADKIP